MVTIQLSTKTCIDEAAESPEVHLRTANLSVDEAAGLVIRYLEQQNILGES